MPSTLSVSDLTTHDAAENVDEAGLAPTCTRRHARCSVPSITLRPSAEEKARFKLLAQHLGLSESALALNAIRALLERDDVWLRRQSPLNPQYVAATDRITIRLRPGDGLAVIQRAAERGFKPATYISALVRAHIMANPPLPSAEVNALKMSLGVLAGLGRCSRRRAATEFRPALRESSTVRRSGELAEKLPPSSSASSTSPKPL